ncbi:MAG: hypothetical protein ABIQ11_01425, partial [Saprospiraceae bacterium]
MNRNAVDMDYVIENHSFLDQMYRGWVLIFSIAVLVPLRWLPTVLPKGSSALFPVLPLALALVTCGELVLNNPTITPAGPYCKGDIVTVSFTGTNLPEGEDLQLYIDDVSSYNPFSGGGALIGTTQIDYNCSTCPNALGIMINPCTGISPPEQNDEFMLLYSGCGLIVSELQVTVNTGSGQNVDQNIGLSNFCQFQSDNSALVSQILANSSGCTGHVFSAGPTDVIPPASIIIVFTDTDATLLNYDFSALCATGLNIYVLRSTCNRFSGAFTNAAGTYTYGFSTNSCSDNITYTNPPAGSTTTNVFINENGSGSVSTSCTHVPLSSVSYPDIPFTTASFSYTIPASICGSNNGPTPFYLSGMMDLIAPCEDIIYTPPSALSMSVMCPPVITPSSAGPF